MICWLGFVLFWPWNNTPFHVATNWLLAAHTTLPLYDYSILFYKILYFSWGHDFRSAYRHLNYIRNRFPQVPCMACTATATPKVIDDIRETLQLIEAPCHIGSFDRPNIFYKVRYRDALDATHPGGAIADLCQYIAKVHAQALKDQVPCSGIVYVHKRADTAMLASAISRNSNIQAAPYHAGLKDAQRTQVQHDWSNNHVQVAVATVAFGMGIDLAHVRYVIHCKCRWTVEYGGI
jgi:superfamily II DNA helicase RecQ